MLATTAFTNLSRPRRAAQMLDHDHVRDRGPAGPGVRHAVTVAARCRWSSPAPADVGCHGRRRVSHHHQGQIAGGRGRRQSTFLRWAWYASRRQELHLDGADDDFSTPARVKQALRTVVAPELRLTLADQQSLAPYARIVRYGAEEMVQCPGEVPTAMTFLVAGRVQLTVDRRGRSAVPCRHAAPGLVHRASPP